MKSKTRPSVDRRTLSTLHRVALTVRGMIDIYPDVDGEFFEHLAAEVVTIVREHVGGGPPDPALPAKVSLERLLAFIELEDAAAAQAGGETHNQHEEGGEHVGG